MVTWKEFVEKTAEAWSGVLDTSIATSCAVVVANSREGGSDRFHQFPATRDEMVEAAKYVRRTIDKFLTDFEK